MKSTENRATGESHTEDFLTAALNLSHFHREHEKFYAQEPLEQALVLQRISRVLKALADRWIAVMPEAGDDRVRYIGCEDLNDRTAVELGGVLFMEGEGEPAEIGRLKRELVASAEDFEQTGMWLSQAMESSWASAAALASQPELSDLLGERHRIISNDWQAASMSSLIARILQRATAILEAVDFDPSAIRADLAESRRLPGYIYSATELIDRAADLASESAILVHENERRWRVFRARVEQIIERPAQSDGRVVEDALPAASDVLQDEPKSARTDAETPATHS